MEVQHIIIIVIVLGLLFLLFNQQNENLRPVVEVTKGIPGGQCGTAFVNMSYDHSEKEKLYKTCPRGFKCTNETCIPRSATDKDEMPRYKYQEYDVA